MEYNEFEEKLNKIEREAIEKIEASIKKFYLQRESLSSKKRESLSIIKHEDGIYGWNYENLNKNNMMDKNNMMEIGGSLQEKESTRMESTKMETIINMFDEELKYYIQNTNQLEEILNRLTGESLEHQPKGDSDKISQINALNEIDEKITSLRMINRKGEELINIFKKYI